MYAVGMKVQGTYRGRTYKEVTIEHDFDKDPLSDDVLAGYAMHAVGENRSSLFGWTVDKPSIYPHMAVVTLHTD